MPLRLNSVIVVSSRDDLRPPHFRRNIQALQRRLNVDSYRTNLANAARILQLIGGASPLVSLDHSGQSCDAIDDGRFTGSGEVEPNVLLSGPIGEERRSGNEDHLFRFQ